MGCFNRRGGSDCEKKVVTITIAMFFCLSVALGEIMEYLNKNSELACAESRVIAFSDVKETDWYYEDVCYARENNLMNGVSHFEFSPDDSATRGMIVTILWRLEGKPSARKNSFDDVFPNVYYCEAVSWASDNKIVGGYSADVFAPEDKATREQLATIIYRYASYKGYDVTKTSSINGYADVLDIEEYAVPAFEWALENKIITGTSDTTLSPKEYVKRCQLAAILKRFCTNIAKEENKSETILPEKTEDEGSDREESFAPEKEANTDKPPKISLSSVSGKPGEEIAVVVDLKNNPGILGMSLTLYYDETKCSLLSVENGNALKDVLEFTTSKNLGNGAKFVWDGIEILPEQVKNGEILTMHFKILEDTSGSCPITLKCFDGDVVDNNL